MKLNDEMLWWETPDGESHEVIIDYVDRLVSDQNYQHDLNLQNFRLYNDEEVTSLQLSGYAQPVNGFAGRHKVTLNVIKSMVDAATSEITANQPTTTFLTSGGDWAQQRKAQLLERFSKGQFEESGIYDVAPRVFTDACVFGTGVMKIYESDGDIKCERIFPDEIVVDTMESRYAKPRQMFQLKVIGKQVLKYLYPDRADVVDKAIESGNYRSYNERLNDAADEQVMCIEAWHLPSGKDAGDGRHTIVVEGGTLLDESYKAADFPFVTLNWTDRLLGFWGQGLSEMLTGIQVEINTLLRDIQEAMNLAKPKVYIEKGSQIAKAQINNQMYGVVEYIGTPPVFYVPKPISGDAFSHLDRLFERAYQIAGVSEMTAQARKPVGLESGVALREVSNIQSRRFFGVARRYERIFVEAAKQMINLARTAVAEGREYETVSHGDQFIEKIKWKDIDLKEDTYVMKVTPTNMLPDTPAGKLEFLREMMEAGLIEDPLMAMRLLKYPDIESATSLLTVSHDIVDMFITEMLEKGKYASPEPFMDLTLTVKKTQAAYLMARMHGAPEERLRLLLRFMRESMELLATMAQAAGVQEQMMAPPPGPGGAPGPAPAPPADDLASILGAPPSSGAGTQGAMPPMDMGTPPSGVM